VTFRTGVFTVAICRVVQKPSTAECIGRSGRTTRRSVRSTEEELLCSRLWSCSCVNRAQRRSAARRDNAWRPQVPLEVRRFHPRGISRHPSTHFWR